MEAFLSDIDRSLSSSRRVFEQLERKGISEPQENEWEQLKSQVIQRGTWDCPICLIAVCETELDLNLPDLAINKLDAPCCCHVPTCSTNLV
ncbi:hypothetical protein CHARACLAT_026519 [Characodon lateralis]|uniref:Uncharacterized protein n=1 Tax=Characodon lateralis TaxID=208331 RepID=A0ABU7EEX2_9TELE|nr:hypothetical protein [Characodon lateralis]